MSLRAPFPWFGGKSRAAHLVWAAFGDVPNYVEPFAGSLAVLLGRPTPARVETVNDLDCYLANFWRAVKWAPDEVAEHADWPVNEVDLHARHRWLVNQADFRERLRRDPKFYDAQIAGWRVWGICQWIGGGWCAASNWAEQPRVRGVNTSEEERRPSLHWGNGVHRQVEQIEIDNEKRPSLGKGARGVQRGAQSAEWNQVPMIAGSRGASGRGVHSKLPLLSGGGGRGTGVHQKMPKANRGTESRLQTTALQQWMQDLAARLRRVRVCCGDWSRVLGRSSTELIGVTGILLDPPYSAAAGRDPSLYSTEDLDVAHQVREWAIANGSNPKLRIALCGYEGEHDMPADWQCVPWKAVGGYAASAGNTENALRERIWFSPACQRIERAQRDLFAEGAA